MGWRGIHDGGRCTYIFCTMACRRLLTGVMLAQVTIDMLPEVALLKIFDFMRMKRRADRGVAHAVHVCRKWRNIVFASPCRLDLRLFCDARTPVRETLDVWPLLPIVTKVHYPTKWRCGHG